MNTSQSSVAAAEHGLGQQSHTLNSIVLSFCIACGKRGIRVIPNPRICGKLWAKALNEMHWQLRHTYRVLSPLEKVRMTADGPRYEELPATLDSLLSQFAVSGDKLLWIGNAEKSVCFLPEALLDAMIRIARENHFFD
jgi:hypothetical protein